MVDWLIIGSGIHGTHLSLRLVAEAGVARTQLRVLDAEPEILGGFSRVIDAVGMAHLRSPSAHHLDLDPRALERYALSRDGRPRARFYFPYRRPAVPLFAAHCRSLIAREGLEALRTHAEVTGVERCEGAWRVSAGSRSWTSRNVLLAPGAGGQLARPAWSEGHDAVVHVFDRAFERRLLGEGERIAIIGGGISAVQLALAIAAQGEGQRSSCDIHSASTPSTASRGGSVRSFSTLSRVRPSASDAR